MKRAAFGLGALLSLATMACSSKALDDEGEAGSAAGGTKAGTAGDASKGGAPSNGGAASGGSAAAAPGGAPSDTCTDPAIMCLDDVTATACDPLTGEVQTANCPELYLVDGMISSCTTDAEGAGCSIDAFTDAECEAGMVPFAVCADLTQNDLIDVYVACFHDNLMQAHMAISCYADYIDEEAKTVDCVAADAACLPAE
jgi:hypothetical protein